LTARPGRRWGVRSEATFRFLCRERSAGVRWPTPRRTEGQEAAQVFRLIHQGMSLREIVMRARVPPHRVRALYREWAHSLEQGPVPGGHVLGDGAELDVLAAVAEG
jgi:hypothetical protein